MNITIVQGAFFPVPPIRGGAVEKYWYTLARFFAQQGHQVTYIARAVPEQPEQEQIDGIRFLRIKGYDQPASLFKLKLCDLLYSLRAWKLLPEADVTVTNTFWLPLLPISRRCGMVYVHIARQHRGQFRYYWRADRLQPASSHIAEDVVAACPALKRKTKAINNALPEAFIVTPRENSNRPANRLLFVGRIHPEKGLNALLDAFLRLRQSHPDEWRLDIVGPWDTAAGGGGKAYFDQLKAKLPAEQSQVRWHGPVYQSAALLEYFRQADYLVYPSIAEHGEASPLTPVEAMSQGCVPIVTDFRCFGDYLQNGKNGYTFSAHNGSYADGLWQCLSGLAGKPVDASVREAALETARRFTVDKIARAYLQDFQDLLDNSKR